jgi:uncharacterized protein (TIGR03663 family)
MSDKAANDGQKPGRRQRMDHPFSLARYKAAPVMPAINTSAGMLSATPADDVARETSMTNALDAQANDVADIEAPETDVSETDAAELADSVVDLTEEQEIAQWQADQRTPPLPLHLSIIQWLRARTWEQWAFVGIFVIGAVLRLWDLGAKPLHHDESLHAYYSWQFMINPSGYQYDPLLHGPFQFHVIPIFFMLGKVFGAPDGGINDTTVRLLPALMGLAMVAMPYWLRNQMGRWGALSMALLLAVSPTFVYYSRFVRDDIYVTCCTLLIVVGAVQYAQTRKVGWLLTAAAALMISYTAMENTFFTVAVFGSFLAALLLWDLGPRAGDAFAHLRERDRPLVGRLAVLTPFVVFMGALAFFGLKALGALSATINALATKYGNDATNPNNPDVIEQQWELKAVAALLVVSIIISMAATVGLFLRMRRQDEPVRAPRWHRWVDPQRQPVLDAILDTDWVRWFLAFVVMWIIFAAFFFEIPANPGNFTMWANGFRDGLGRGLLRGIYYWLEQQQVQRGGQPWYYYFILIPLYEPLALVFGLAGAVRAIVQPTRFRLFLLYWFGVNLLLYSWAGEKMPWLVIHIMLPLIGLAGVSLDWVIGTLVRGARSWWTPTRVLAALALIFAVGGLVSMTVATTMFFALAFGAATIVLIGVAAALENGRAVITAAPKARMQRGFMQAMFLAIRIVYLLALVLLAIIGALHHMMALEVLAGVGVLAVPFLEWALRQAWRVLDPVPEDATAFALPVVRQPRWSLPLRQGVAAGSLALAAVLFVPTVWNMQRVTFFEPSVAPNEMLIYVQTTTDVQLAMSKIAALDTIVQRTEHRGIRVGVTPDAVWPFAWYLRDYPAVYDPHTRVWVSGTLYDYSSSTGGPLPDVILGGLSDGSQDITAVYPGKFQSKEYRLRWWWDESYKLPQCDKITPTNCLTNPPLGVGDGPLLWISYGSNPPAPCSDPFSAQCSPLNAQPNGALAAQRYWNWLWHRQNISGTDPESTDFILYISTPLTQYVGV